MNIRSFENIDVRGKFVLLRDDFNVQIIDGKIKDSFRITQSMPTIRKLSESGAKVAIVAHFGRPNGVRDMGLSLAPIAEYMKIPFIPDCLDKDFMQDMKNGDVVLLENVRFYSGEEEDCPKFSAKLANGFDVFINDAFAVSHRAHASTVGVTKILPSYAGELLLSEIKQLTKIIENPKRPLLSIVAGGKVSTKIGVLKSLAKLSDKLIVDGAIGTTFAFANGANVGNSLYEPNMKDTALEIMEFAKQNDCELFIPIDKGVGKVFSKDADRVNKPLSEIQDDDIIMDSGIETTKRNIEIINSVKTVLWNGTFGMAEWNDKWGYASFEIARAIAKQTRAGELESIVGGGDTVALLEKIDIKDDITYISTGGGAFLEFIEGLSLPGIKALEIA
ncbi:MAG: phosphoglycerate kinase [Alphaproteobacteria bacterium]|nr:phosphoglycerate kinase [Alphaproteobacteria bacterium]MBN2675072.1 phosphoglycerate kinase [Alphaproteobacteria bacterium]